VDGQLRFYVDLGSRTYSLDGPGYDDTQTAFTMKLLQRLIDDGNALNAATPTNNGVNH